MFFYSLLAVFAVTMASSMSLGFDSIEEQDRIVNGTTAKPGQFPYMASVRELGRFYDVDTMVHWRHTCGGSIISNRWVLTVAHCTNGPPSAFRIYLGAHHIINDGTAYTVKRVVVHPNYKAPSANSDISLMKTAKRIKISELVKPIPLRKLFVPRNVQTIVTGWGNVEFKHNSTSPDPEHLQYMRARTVTNDFCRKQHVPPLSNRVDNTTLCTFSRPGQGVCFFDDGGPLVAAGQLIGLVSWSRACGQGVPDGFVRVSEFLIWIEQVSAVVAE